MSKAIKIKHKISKKTEKVFNNEEQTKTIWLNIKVVTIVKIVLVTLLTFYLSDTVSKLSNIFYILIISFIISAALSPIVDWFYQRKVPKTLSIASIYLLIIGLIYTLVVALVPIAIRQLTKLADYLIKLIEKIQVEGINSVPYLSFITNYVDESKILIVIRDTLDLIATKIGNISGGLIKLVTSILSNTLSVTGLIVTIFFVSYYILINEKNFSEYLVNLVPLKYKDYFCKIGREIWFKQGAWLRGQLLLSLVVSGICYTFLSIIGSEYAFTIALITAITEFIPIVGPLIAAFPATLLSLSQGTPHALVVLIFYLIFNSIESNIITPFIMNKAVGLNPLTVIISMIIGFTLIGPLGIILAVPVAAAFMVVLNDYMEENKRKNAQSSEDSSTDSVD